MVPTLPKNPLPEPDDADYHRKQLEFEDRINELFSELKDFRQEYSMKQREMKDHLSGRGAVYSELKEHFDELRIHQDERRKIFKLRETFDAQIQDLVRESQKLLKLCHPTYNTVDDLDKGVKILNRRIETNTLT